MQRLDPRDREEAQRSQLARTYAAAVPFDRASHFDSIQSIEKTGGISNETRERYYDSPRIAVLPQKPLHVYLSRGTSRKIVSVDGDITKPCAIITGELLPRLRSSAVSIHKAITSPWMFSTDYFTDQAAELVVSAAGSQSTVSRLRLVDDRALTYFKKEVLLPLSQYGRIAIAFAAILHARQLHDQFDIAAPVSTQLFAAITNRLDREQGGASWIAALFADILHDKINADLRPQQNRAVLWCARILMDSLEKISHPVSPERSYEILVTIKSALEKLPEGLGYSDYSQRKRIDVRISRREELSRADELCRQREDYFRNTGREIA
jgi:hypothetical protein